MKDTPGPEPTPESSGLSCLGAVPRGWGPTPSSPSHSTALSWHLSLFQSPAQLCQPWSALCTMGPRSLPPRRAACPCLPPHHTAWIGGASTMTPASSGEAVALGPWDRAVCLAGAGIRPAPAQWCGQPRLPCNRPSPWWRHMMVGAMWGTPQAPPDSGGFILKLASAGRGLSWLSRPASLCSHSHRPGPRKCQV